MTRLEVVNSTATSINSWDYGNCKPSWNHVMRKPTPSYAVLDSVNEGKHCNLFHKVCVIRFVDFWSLYQHIHPGAFAVVIDEWFRRTKLPLAQYEDFLSVTNLVSWKKGRAREIWTTVLHVRMSGARNLYNRISRWLRSADSTPIIIRCNPKPI